MSLQGRGNLGDRGITRAQLRQGGGRGNGNDHLEEMIGATELFVYQTPNKKPKGFESLKLFLAASECELISTLDVPPELKNYEAFRVTHKSGEKIPDEVLKRCHSWAHGRNFLHSFFKPMYGTR
ncbi:MAG: hypothetical protein FI708_02865 [SAR202 cluster bacterium]|uniref:Uncharacterized protein n=1 Tax=hydrothermal vent metagenome TaxID=652676 RepID=A0A161JV66_9ZZZZ|nr:hypothetical protein [Dehalococcoidia bacterium]MQF90447.1 hypothetical protein [SAR202 cluster bacterium]MCH2500480.1 hypothetical protein [Dehalococcoidia bacterium]MCL0053518.1 hypothetical protein [Dehalococcoidia bacterium]MQG61661.1 hypothetical protein [SAR202 cluster bacterium]|tara:strand:- start:634 stop:1005 length:372 start_codon:yes stop_codon:yes gene_type:complete